MRMMQQTFFSSKSILVVDASKKNTNDRTWCFWETNDGIFQSIVHHQWQQIDFYSNTFSARYDLAPYAYKMIRSVDLYNYVLGRAQQFKNITIINEEIISIANENETAVINTATNSYSAKFVFNSIGSFFPSKKLAHSYYLLQHFKGWLIQTDQPAFNNQVATFMDFRVSQQYGATFVYVLPVSANKALIEYTLFSEKVLPDTIYDTALEDYIKTFLKPNSYNILEEEFGIIPMTNQIFDAGKKNVVNIGAAGGQTKASSGFTFQFIQKHTRQIMQALLEDKDPHIAKDFFEKRFNLYDSTLLNILQNKKLGGNAIFTSLFKYNPPQRILKFLDNETSFTEDLKIMNSVPVKVFLPAAMKEMIHAVTGK